LGGTSGKTRQRRKRMASFILFFQPRWKKEEWPFFGGGYTAGKASKKRGQLYQNRISHEPSCEAEKRGECHKGYCLIFSKEREAKLRRRRPEKKGSRCIKDLFGEQRD